MNILVMGSDARIGQGDGFGQVSKYGDSARSDTTLLVHLYKGHKQAVVVSIPRDSWVTIPACTREDGSTTSPWTTKFNAAFSTAGPACTITTVEQLTGLYIDHFAVVDFKGFEAMVDAVGGVSMCLTAPVSDSKSHLDLPAGTSLLDGKTALAFVRTRYAMGDGSDTARIHRQQGFLSALTRKIKSAGVLLNPVKLYKLLDATTSSLTMDPAFASLKELQSVALSLKDLQSKNLRFVTVPSASDGTGNVVWTSKAQDLWDALKADALWPAPGTLGFDGKPLTVDPSDVHVDILNTTTKTLSRITDSMTALGYSIEAASETNTRVARTTISAGADGFEAARTLAAALGIRTVALDPTNTGSQVTLTIGRDFAPPLGVNVNPEFKDANSTSIYGPSSGITADNSACTTV
jgi:LCP family protein required for cell wall assembly